MSIRSDPTTFKRLAPPRSSLTIIRGIKRFTNATPLHKTHVNVNCYAHKAIVVCLNLQRTLRIGATDEVRGKPALIATWQRASVLHAEAAPCSNGVGGRAQQEGARAAPEHLRSTGRIRRGQHGSLHLCLVNSSEKTTQLKIWVAAGAVVVATPMT